VFITLSARSLHPGIEIIARGEAPTTESKLRHAGADQVVLPTHIGAERIARMVLYPESRAARDAAVHGAEQALEGVGLSLESLVVGVRSAAAGLTVKEAERLGSGAYLIVRIGRDDEALRRPTPDERIHKDDRLMIVTRDSAAAARMLVAPRGAIRVGRNTF